MLIFILLFYFNLISINKTQSIDPTPASTTTSGSPKAGCKFEGESCEFLEGKILSIIPNIPTVDQCNSLCQENPDCTFSTHFGSEGFPLFSSCVLFSSCEILHSCWDCTTSDPTCTKLVETELCVRNVEGRVGDNLVAFHSNVPNITSCRSSCFLESGCKFYTFHQLSDPEFPGACFLLSSLLEPLQESSIAQTGAINCSEWETPCYFLDPEGSPIYGDLMVTDTQETQVVQLVAQGPCGLVIVAVGGGGVGDYGDFSGGSGSGFVEWKRENLTRSMELEVSVGGTGRRSIVSSNGTILVEAAAGGGPPDYTGGNSYSGGGGGGKDQAGKGIIFAFHSIFAINISLLSFFFFLPAKGPILPVSLFASKRAYLAFFFICQHRW